MSITTIEEWEHCINKWSSPRKLERERRKLERKQRSKFIEKRNSFYLKELRKNMTRAERQFGFELCNAKIPFLFQKGFFKPFHRIVDFYLPGKGIIIEIDGLIHNKTLQKDTNKDYSFWVMRGFRTIRFKNEDVFKPNIVERIKEEISKCFYEYPN